MRNQLRTRGIPFVIVDPTGEPMLRHPVGGSDQLEWRPDRHSSPAQPGPHSDRGGGRTERHPVQPRPTRRLSARRWTLPAWPSIRPSSRMGAFAVEEGIERGRALLSAPNPPTAIVTGNDLQALGVYQAARELRMHIPEDLSVVGFDDLPVARWVGPPLTTVRQPLVEMAANGRGDGSRRSRAAKLPLSRALSCRLSSSCARARHARRPTERNHVDQLRKQMRPPRSRLREVDATNRSRLRSRDDLVQLRHERPRVEPLENRARRFRDRAHVGQRGVEDRGHVEAGQASSQTRSRARHASSARPYCAMASALRPSSAATPARMVRSRASLTGPCNPLCSTATRSSLSSSRLPLPERGPAHA